MLQATESRMKGTSRDKESLLEECLALKDALCDQLYHLQLHKIHHESANVEQRLYL
jgi:flagellar motility protein MotE (MotC chaperone)